MNRSKEYPQVAMPRQRSESAAQYHPSHHEFITFLGACILFLFAGCAQLDQLMGKQTAAAEPSPSQNADPTSGTMAISEKSPGQAKESAAKPAAKKKSEESSPTGVAKEHHPDQDKVLAEKDQLQKEKKSHVASDKKPKKSPKSLTEPQPTPEDVFLSPVPLPSKPAAIGGSGG